MSAKRELREGLKNLNKHFIPYSVLCKVVNVDLDNMVIDCESLDEGANILDVKLMAAN